MREISGDFTSIFGFDPTLGRKLKPKEITKRELEGWKQDKNIKKMTPEFKEQFKNDYQKMLELYSEINK